MSTGRHQVPVSVIFCVLVAVGGGFPAPPAAAEPVSPGVAVPLGEAGWRVVSSPFADLWFHGLAVVGFNGTGNNPLYDPAYGRRAAAARPTGALASEATALLTAFRRDPAFEFMHFIPVYLAGAGPRQGLDLLRTVALSTDASPRLPTDGPGAGAALVAEVLATRDQRRVLARFVAALDAELASGLATELAEAQATREPWLRDLEERWSRDFVPALARYLEAHGLTGGWIVPTRALGIEGRFFQGDPGETGDNVVMVGPGDVRDDPEDILAAVVRELCYPAVREAFREVQARYADREAAGRASDAAATRCGELLLEHRLPGALQAYRARFGIQASHGVRGSFLPDPDERDAWDQALMRALDLSRGP